MPSGRSLVASVVLLLTLSSCGIGRISIPVRSPGDPAPTPHTTQWGVLLTDSLVLYHGSVASGKPVTKEIIPLKGGHLRIDGYTTAGDHHTPFDGFVRRDGDSLEFEKRETQQQLRRATSEVTGLDVWVPGASGRSFVYVIVGALAAAIITIAFLGGGGFGV